MAGAAVGTLRIVRFRTRARSRTHGCHWTGHFHPAFPAGKIIHPYVFFGAVKNRAIARLDLNDGCNKLIPNQLNAAENPPCGSR